MILQLERPVAFVDVETTGTAAQVDRVVQVGVFKIYPDGRERDWSSLINPEVPIPPEVTAVHHITDEMVAIAPKFHEVAALLATGFMGADTGGYNVKFDVSFLVEELRRAGRRNGANYLVPGVLDGHMVDSNRIYHSRERRTLAAAHERYLKCKLEGAHDALVDAKAAARILEAQLEEYPDLPRTPQGLHDMFFETPAEGDVDPEGKFVWKHGEAVINFSLKQGTRLRDVDRGWLRWVLRRGFSDRVKGICRDALRGEFPRREA